MSLNNSKCCDAEGLQLKPVKYVVDIIPPCLVHIFQFRINMRGILFEYKAGQGA